MRKRILDIGLAAFLAAGLAGHGAALAQDDFDDDFGDELGDDDFGEPTDDLDAGEEAEPAEEAAAAPAGASEQRLVLRQGSIGVHGFVEINLSDDVEFEPVSIAPDVWYGVSDELSVGLIHSTYGATGFYGIGGGSAVPLGGAGICVTGEDSGCPKFYNNVGLDARYLFMADGDLKIAANAGLFANSIDPFALSLKAGVVGSWNDGGPLTVVFNPNVFVGLTERDFNVSSLNVPVEVQYAVTEELGVLAQTGIAGPIESIDFGFGDVGFGDLWRIPLSIGASYSINPGLAVAGIFSLPTLAGGDAWETGVDNRSFTLALLWYN